MKKRISVATGHPYEVLVEDGLLSQLGPELKNIADGKVLVVTDENVAPLYLAAAYRSLHEAGFAVSTICLPSGESSKELKYYVNLLNLLSEKNFSRSDTVVALGGGVIGDLAGFAAATYLRGIRFVQVPTTLLAMVDASVGGKTAINLPSGKNQVGAFHQPSLVLCDPCLLDTLPERELRCGCAEVIKTAILFDPELFAHLSEHGLSFDRNEVIARCIAHKSRIVACDEHDHGQRQLLNLGHTIGHAIETLTDYMIPHGEAVSVGCCVLAKACSSDYERILSLFDRFCLPTKTEFSAPVLANAAIYDKKRNGNEITLVVPKAISQCELQTVPVTALEAIIKAGL